MMALVRRAVLFPKSMLAAGMLITLLLGLGLFRLDIQTDGASLHPRNNPVVVRTTTDRHHFSEPERALILVQPKGNAPDITTQQGMLRLEQLHQSLQRQPGVANNGVFSIVSLLDVSQNPNINLACLPTYLDSVPSADWAHEALLGRIMARPEQRGLWLSQDGKAAALLVSMDGKAQRAAFAEQLQNWADAESSDYLLSVTGPLVAEATLGNMVLKDLAVFVPLMVLVIALLLLPALKNLAGLVLVMTEVGLTLICVLGLMGWLGAPITLVTTILPVVVMSMAITDEIHFLERFGHYLPGSSRDVQARTSAVLSACGDVARPVILTSVTTALGFLSFLTANMAPIQQFGLFTALGILLAMVLTFTVLPAVLVLLPSAWFVPLPMFKHPVGIIRRVEKTLTGRPAFLVLLILIGLAIPGIFRLRIQDAWVDNFDPEASLVQAERDYNTHFWGSYRLDLVLKGPPGYFHTNTGATLVQSLSQHAEQAPGVGGVYSYLAPYAKIAELQGDVSGKWTDHRLNEVGKVMKFTGEEMVLHEVLDKEGAWTRLMLFVNSPHYALGVRLQDYLHQGPTMPPEVSRHFSGDLPVAVEVVGGIVSNQLRSISWTLLGIGLVLLVVIPRKTAIPVLLAPIAAAAVLVLGAMGWLGLHLGIATSMFTALAMGVGVDFSIHFHHAWRIRRRREDHPTAVAQTLTGVGRALRWNMAVLAIGFLTLTFSSLKPNHQLGLLLAASMTAAYLCTLVLLPRLLSRFKP